MPGQEARGRPISNIEKIVVAMICGAIIYASKLVPTLLSGELNGFSLYASFSVFGLYGVLWFYTSLILAPKNPQWYDDRRKLIAFATVLGLLGSLLWIIALWRGYGFLSLPLWLVSLIFIMNVNGISFSIPRKSKVM